MWPFSLGEMQSPYKFGQPRSSRSLLTTPEKQIKINVYINIYDNKIKIYDFYKTKRQEMELIAWKTSRRLSQREKEAENPFSEKIKNVKE